MRVLISPARPVESTKPPLWITYMNVPSRDSRSKKTEQENHERPAENPHLGLQPKDYPAGPLTLREGAQPLSNRGPLHMKEYRHGVLTPRSTSTLPGPKDTPRTEAFKPTGTLEMDETLKDILGSQTNRLSRRQTSSFQVHPVGSSAMVFPWHSTKSGKKTSARVTNIVKEHSKSRVTTLEDGSAGEDVKVPPLDLSRLHNDTPPSSEMQILKPKAIPPIQTQVNEPELSRTIGVRAHLDLYRDSVPPPSPFTYHQQEKKKKKVMVVVPKMPAPHISGHLDSVRSEGVTRALDSYNDYSLTKQDKGKRPSSSKKKVMFVSPNPEPINTSRLSDGVSQALSSYEGDNFAQPEPQTTKKKVIIVTKQRGPKEEPYFETCRSDGVKGALDFYNDYGLTPRRDVPPYVSPRGQETRKITEMGPPHMGELTRSRIKSGGVRNTISSFINMDDGVTIKDILATKKRVKTLPTVTPRNANAIFEPKKDCQEVGVVGALTSYNDSSLTPRDIHPTILSQETPRFGPDAQPQQLMNALQIADRTTDALDTARETQQQRDMMEMMRNEERYRRDFPDPSRHLPPVHNPEEQKREGESEDWKWTGPTSAKFHWRTDARRRHKEEHPDEEHDVNKRMHNREFKGPMYLL